VCVRESVCVRECVFERQRERRESHWLHVLLVIVHFSSRERQRVSV